MFNIDKKQQKLAKKQEKWEQEKPIVIGKQDLKEDKIFTKRRLRREKKALTTTKFLMLFLFISCTAIQAFTLIITILSMQQGVYDFTALQMLITAVVGQVIAFAVYSLKSLKENTKGGIVYQTAMQQYSISPIPEEDNDQEAQG